MEFASPLRRGTKYIFFLSQYQLSSCMVYGTPNVVKQFVVYALWVSRDLITFFFWPVCGLPTPLEHKFDNCTSEYESNQPVQLFKWICYTAEPFYQTITEEIKFHLCFFINFVQTGRSVSRLTEGSQCNSRRTIKDEIVNYKLPSS
jgi:hypothetical protein